MTAKHDHDQVIRRLNELLEKDRRALQVLIEHRELCNKGLVGSPLINVHDSEYGSRVGLLEILNSVLGLEAPMSIKPQYHHGVVVRFHMERSSHPEKGHSSYGSTFSR